MYTIGQVSEMFNIPISTLRYYDKEGLFPNIHRESGIRKFDEKEIEALRIIECLKKSGLEIKIIKQFMQWCEQGSETYIQRKNLFVKQKETVPEVVEQPTEISAAQIWGLVFIAALFIVCFLFSIFGGL